MNETLITDLVAQEALDQLNQLDRLMEGTLEQFQDCARELARGLKIPVEVTGDLDKLQQLSNTTMQRASQAAQQYTQQLQQQQQVIANTTNTISRQLAEQEKFNKAQREAYQIQERGLSIVERTLGSHEANVHMLADYNKQLKQLRDEYKAGAVTAEEYTRRELELKTVKQETQRILTNETKMMQAAEGSYQRLSLQLERMKMAQKQLNEEEKNGAEGQALEAEIQKLDAHLKDLAADMGEFQRNVGNYAVANGSLRTELKELTMQMAQMLADGVDPTSEGFLQVAERAGKLKDAMSDAQSTIKDYANDTKALTNTISVLQTATAGWQSVAGAMSAFGLGSEDAAKATQKLMGIMSLMNGIQKISTELTTNGTGAYRAYHAILRLLGIEMAAVTAATQAETVAEQANAVAAAENAAAESATATATEAATVASGSHVAAVEAETVALAGATTAATALRVALAALGIGAVIALVAALYEAVSSFNEEAEKAAEEAKGLSDAVKEGAKSTAGAAAELRYYKGVVDDFNGSAKEEKAIVEELNNKYGESLGYYKSIAEWKATLASLGEYYIDVLKWEAVAQANLNKYAEAQANGDFALAKRYEEEFEFYKKMAAQQSKVLQNLIKLRGASTSRPSSSGRSSGSRSGNTSSSTDDAAAAESRMQELIKEANEMLDEWQQNAVKRLIGIESLITSASIEDFKGQVETIKQQYEDLGELIEEDRRKAVEEKQKEYEEAIKAAKKYGKDTTQLEEALNTALTAIDNDYQAQLTENMQERDETIEQMSTDLLSLLERENSKNLSDIATTNAVKLAFLRDQYAEELMMAQGNEKKIADIKRRYAMESADQVEKAAIDTAEATVRGLEQILAVEQLTDEDRERISEQLSKAKIALEKAVADATVNQLARTREEEDRARRERMKEITDWVQKAGEAVSKVGDLFSSMYDSQIEMIEKEMETEQERHDREIEHIETLADREAITKEEAEIRKREAEAATAAKQGELEKRKAQMEYKKAVMEKANTISQIGIATALGIMQTYAQLGWPAGIAGAIFIGTMGALQAAAALAQPIKAYKEGTKGKPHPGGLALVGDGNKAELVLFDGKAWVTPDHPTVVDLPKGAEVFPDANEKDLLSMGSSLQTAIPRDRRTGQPVIINDYSALESRVATNTKAVTQELRNIRSDIAHELRRMKFNAYVKSRI